MEASMMEATSAVRRHGITRVNWVTALFLLLTPLVTIVWGVAYVRTTSVRAVEVALFAFYVCATGFSITTGYHRLFAHRSYECSRIVKIVYLLFGAAAFQHSVLTWCSEHRRHHKHLDGDADPYNIRHGFFWAHMGWLLVTDHREQLDLSNVGDLMADPWIRFQHRFYLPIAVVMGFGVPFAFGWAVGYPWGCVLWAGLFRVVLVHHSTFLVNSLAHTLGRRPYVRAVSARDSVVTALLTFGEGYHNFHHRFASDYRNGVARAAWDPSKWLIRTLEMVGLASNLRRVSRARIIAARLQCDSQRLFQRLSGHSELAVTYLRERCASVAASVEHAASELDRRERELAAARAYPGRGRRSQLKQLRMELRAARRELRAAHLRWRVTLSDLSGRGLAPTS
jgi:stearoyl-CoA desaturase (delta-9 desaturase)